jgi:hypothetical protein
MRIIRLLVQIALVVFIASILAVWFLPRPSYTFPPTSDIASIEAKIYYLDEKTRTVEVPRSLYDELFLALSPSSYDIFPAKWQVLGQLEVRTKNGMSIHISLYDLKDPVGAFSAGASFESRSYYRGGNSTHVKSVLERARAATAK